MRFRLPQCMSKSYELYHALVYQWLRGERMDVHYCFRTCRIRQLRRRQAGNLGGIAVSLPDTAHLVRHQMTQIKKPPQPPQIVKQAGGPVVGALGW